MDQPDKAVTIECPVRASKQKQPSLDEITKSLRWGQNSKSLEQSQKNRNVWMLSGTQTAQTELEPRTVRSGPELKNA